MSEQHQKPRPSERRRSPRVKAEHELSLTAQGQSDEGAFIARSIDVSLGGIYCNVDRHIELFSKLSIALTLPLFDEHDHRHLLRIPVEGVVVRMEPEEPESGRTQYACAVSFVHPDPDIELVIAKYILQTMARGMHS